MTLSVYEVRYRIPQGGSYVPPDPCSGGDYHADKHGKQLITCASGNQAKAIMRMSEPTCKIQQVRVLAKVEL